MFFANRKYARLNFTNEADADVGYFIWFLLPLYIHVLIAPIYKLGHLSEKL